jgi:hypothetical protein
MQIMYIAYVVVSILLAAYLAFSTWADFVRFKQVLVAMARAGVPESWLPLLGTLKGAAGVGLLVGIGVPLVGLAAALGVILFFLGAMVVHVRARYYDITFPATFLVLAVAALVLGLNNLDVWSRNCEFVLRGCST